MLDAEADVLERMTAAVLAANRTLASYVLLESNLEDLGYLPGDIVLVDVEMTPSAGDVVRASVKTGRDSFDEVFRLYEPPYLISGSLTSRKRKPLLVDNDQVIISGVVSASVRLSK